MIRGIITDIHRASMVDGPGLRTTVFLKGCPLKCLWCHNPETQSARIEPAFNPDRPEDGVFLYGREVDVEEVVSVVVKDRDYYANTGGGLTLSGGEPMAQPEFALAVLERARSIGIHTTLDTTGLMPPTDLYRACAVTDLFLYDYKATDEEAHRRLTGVGNRTILENLRKLMDAQAQVILRCPMIPGVNDSGEHLAGIVDIVRRYPQVVGVDVLTWHTMGFAKYRNLGKPIPECLPKQNVSDKLKDAYRAYFRSELPDFANLNVL